MIGLARNPGDAAQPRTPQAQEPKRFDKQLERPRYVWGNRYIRYTLDANCKKKYGKGWMKEINGRAFAERFALNPLGYAWLLGAGASATAGIPTGYQMIQEFRTRLYASEAGISLREIDSADPIWQARIDHHHERQGKLPPKWHPSEYSRAFEALYPTPEDRRLYIRNQVSKGSPSLGHKVLGSLVGARKTPCVFTTNFDSLVESAATVASQLLPAGERGAPTLAAIDNAERAETCLRESEWPLIVKLHGDYQSVNLKNTDEELKQQDAQLRLVLTQSLQRFGLVVVGYSGRDESVMQALNAVLRDPVAYPKGIYWLCQDPASLLPAVREFLEQAELAHVNVHLVRGTTFDELFGDIADVTDLPSALVTHIFGDRRTTNTAQVPLQRQVALKAPVLRLSAMPLIEMPRAARKVTLNAHLGISDVRAMLKQANAKAVVGQTGSTGVLAVFGADETLLQALAPLEPTLAGEIGLDIAKDSWAKGVVYDALVRALCRDLPLYARLQGRGHSLSVSRPRGELSPEAAQVRGNLLSKLKAAYGSELTGPVPGTTGKYAEGLSIRLEQADGRWWVVFEPTTFIDLGQPEQDEDPAQASIEWRKAEDWRRERWVQKYNNRWSAILDAWVELLTHAKGARRAAYGLSVREGVDAVFELTPKTARSRPAHDHDYFQIQQGQR